MNSEEECQKAINLPDEKKFVGGRVVTITLAKSKK
jgi:hypothetical protein